MWDKQENQQNSIKKMISRKDLAAVLLRVMRCTIESDVDANLTNTKDSSGGVFSNTTAEAASGI